jgi:ribose transport system substrate-binding protein
MKDTCVTGSMLTAARRRRVLAATSIALLSITAAACGDDSNTGSGDSETVGFSAATLDNPFTVQNVNTVVSDAKAAGLDMLPTTNAGGDTAKQITDVQTLLTQGASGIFLIPRDSDAIVPAIEQANQADVPVVAVDTAVNGGDVYMNVVADNVLMGEDACKQLGEVLGGAGSILELMGDPGTAPGAERHAGFVDCMESDYPDIDVITRKADWVTAKAAEAAQAVLSTTSVDAIYLASDSVMLEAVMNVMKNLDMLVPAGEADHIAIATIDGSSGALEAVRDGFVDAVISQPINGYAEFGVEYMQAALAGETQEPGPTDHDSVIVKYKGSLADKLPSDVVTSENVDDPDLWGNAE